MASTIEFRRKSYFRLSSQIASTESEALLSPPKDKNQPSAWGTTELVRLGQSTVFVKRIPITERELENPFSTRNLYDLPNRFNYGIGSLGRGIFRELVSNIKCTNWVLSGEWPFFPLTYHYRVVPRPPQSTPANALDTQAFVDTWGGNPNIAKYREDRLSARHELVIFQEYFPTPLSDWLKQNPGQTGGSMKSLFETVGFLRRKGIIHFDAHFENVMTDGKHPYLTDFGLAMDRSFSLSEEENAFYSKHTNYDYARLVSCLAFHLEDRYKCIPEAAQRGVKEKLGLPADAPVRPTVLKLVGLVEDLPQDLKLDPGYVQVMVQYRPIFELMAAFISALVDSTKRDAPFPNVELSRQLSRAGA